MLRRKIEKYFFCKMGADFYEQFTLRNFMAFLYDGTATEIPQKSNNFWEQILL